MNSYFRPKFKSMKNIIAAVLLACIVTLTSCSSSSILGGSWTYNGTSYSAITAIGSTTAHTLTATTGSTTELDDLVFHFTSYPPAPGQYTIVNTNPTPGQVYVVMNLGTKVYTIDQSGSAQATVTVSGTKVSVTVGSVTFSNTVVQSPSSGPFTATITQNL